MTKSKDKATDFNLSPENILVKVQETPNPMALKFILNIPLKNEGKSTFRSKKDSEFLPLVASLFDIPGVLQVYLFQNALTLTHEGRLYEDEFIKEVTSVLKTRGPIHNPDFKEQNQEDSAQALSSKAQPQSKELQEIEAILDRTVRPGLQSDGGDIEVLEFKSNKLKVLYQGACGGCPSAMMGTLDAIQNILRHEMNNQHIVVEPV